MATHDQYVDLLAENERLRDRLRAADTKIHVYAYWMARIHRGERDAVSLAERCAHGILNVHELYEVDEPQTRPSPYHQLDLKVFDQDAADWHPPLIYPHTD